MEFGRFLIVKCADCHIKSQVRASNPTRYPQVYTMMFDPPDYPYKELTDHLKDNYDPDDLLFSNVPNDNDREDNLSLINSELVAVTEQMISNVENDLSYQSNDSGRYFNIENLPYLEGDSQNVDQNNQQLFLVQPDNIFNYESTLLDDNTVNQFLLPLQNASDNNDAESKGPDLLALHSCVICHEIFTSDSDLLDHTILMHASIDTEEQSNSNAPILTKDTIANSQTEEVNNNKIDFESDWLVCCLCERVLSTALEVEPTEQLCCRDINGKGSVASRKLHTMYVCDICNGLFADGDALDRHRQQCYPKKQDDYFVEDMARCNLETSTPQCPEVCFSCETCGMQFPTAEQLKLHVMVCQRRVSQRTGRRSYMNNTNNSKMWNCGSCNQLFVTARELYKHKRGEDRPPGAPLTAFVCDECDKVLGSMCALHTHKKMHKVKKPGYPCRICGRRFNQSGHLAIHMRMHTGERPYPCDLCPKAFKVKVERDDHRRTHTGERPFACANCPKTFTAAARLREHARIHTDQRPYRCDICGAAFRRPYARTVHTLIHTGEKPHECDVCGTAFRRSGDMWKHKRTLHGVQANMTDVD